MPLPVALAVAYLAVNLATMLWLERERALGRRPSFRLSVLSAALRYGPPLAGAVYLVAISGDWLFVGFVIGFLAGAFWMMNGLLAFPSIGMDPMRSGWDERQVGRPPHEQRTARTGRPAREADPATRDPSPG